MDLRRHATLFKLVPNDAVCCVRCIEEWRINIAATHRLIHAGEIATLCIHHANKDAFMLMLNGNVVALDGATPVALQLPIPYDVETYLQERNAKYETRHAGIETAQRMHKEAMERAAARDEEKRTRKERSTKRARETTDENIVWI